MHEVCGTWRVVFLLGGHTRGDVVWLGSLGGVDSEVRVGIGVKVTGLVYVVAA